MCFHLAKAYASVEITSEPANQQVPAYVVHQQKNMSTSRLPPDLSRSNRYEPGADNSKVGKPVLLEEESLCDAGAMQDVPEVTVTPVEEQDGSAAEETTGESIEGRTGPQLYVK